MKAAKVYAAIALTLCLFWLPSANAQALKLVPDSALLVYRINNLEGVSKKVADICGRMGVVQMNPGLADPLDMWCKDAGINAGLNRDGDLAVAMLDPTVIGGTANDAILVLIPVSDYQAFLSNFAGSTTEGAITTIHFKDDPMPTYIAHWGDYAAASPHQSIVATQPTTILTIGPMAQKEFDAKDFVAYANVKNLRLMAAPQIEKLRATAARQIDQQAANTPKTAPVDPAKFAPVAKVVVNQVLNLAEEFLNDMDDAVASANLSPDGAGETMIMEFRPDSKLGGIVAQTKMTDGSLLNGLPDTKYLVYGGSISTPAQTSQMVSDFVDPISQSVATLGPDYAAINDGISAFKTLVQTQTGGQFGLLEPTGTLGQDPLLQAVAITRGDSKTLLDCTHKMSDDYDSVMKVLGMQQAAGTTTVTAAAKTTDGVTFDEFQTVLNMNGQNPQQMQAMQFMMFLYGPNGPTKFVGPVNDQTLLTYMGASDPQVTATIEAIKANDDPLAKSQAVKSVAAQLPTQRMSAFYIPLDQWAATGLNYAKQFASMDMGVKIPEDLPPVGVTVSADGSAMRIDAYIPTELVQSLYQAGMQAYMAMHGPGNQGAPPQQQQGNGPGGGL